MTFEIPMMWAIAFVILFTIGGFSGLMLGIAPADIQYHDTYFVVAHFHYVLVTGALFSIIAAVFYWLPMWTGKMFNEKLATIHFWWAMISVNVLFFPWESAKGLEWTQGAKAAYHSFDTPPSRETILAESSNIPQEGNH